jgi:hypothetical protein
MKEEKHWLDTPQTIFIQKMITKIEGGVWNLYSTDTSRGLRHIIELGFYTPSQKSWLRSMRKDYIISFCI